ncbi:MAG: YqaJ viral recombinase family protein [Sphingobium sp.]
MRKVHHLVQGSDEWKAHRATQGMINGSEIAAIMGLSTNTGRGELLRLKSLGMEKEFSDYVQKYILDKGHEHEALARPIAEDIIGDDLSALVMTDTIDGVLFSVSFDGITQGYDTTSEHKSLNQALAAALDAGYLPDEYHPQCEAGLMVSGAKRCLFMASRDGDVSTMRHFWYDSNPELRARMIAACKQFEIDRINYAHTEVAERPAAAVTIELPALFVHAKGEITTHNMDAFGLALTNKLAEVRAIALVTDQDFSNAKEAAKKFRETAKAIALSKEAMLAQTETIGEAARKMDAWVKDMNATALQLEKDVDREDAAKKAAIVSGARIAYVDHIKALNERIGGQYMATAIPNFAEAIKGKRNYGSMTDAVNTMLANAKVEADMLADRIEANSKSLDAGNGEGMDYRFLVPDFAAVCTKARDDFDALVTSRLAAHREREAEKAEAAKKAEDARVAAAVEAERKAGEARAAEAVRLAASIEAARVIKEEAEKAAEPKNFAAAIFKEGTDNPLGGLVEAAQPTPPVQDHFAGAGNMVDAAMIDDFIRLLPIVPAAKKALRADIVAWETYRLKTAAARGLAAAA